MHFHLTFVVRGRFQAFLDEATLRRAARIIVRVVGKRLLSWALPGDHLHALVVGTRAEVGRLGRDLRLALRAIGIVLGEPDVKPIADRDHLENTVVYHLKQARKHESTDRPALFSGCVFPDLIGARAIDGHDPAVLAAHLPRFDVGRHLYWVGLNKRPEPASDDAIRALGAGPIVRAAAAVLCVSHPLIGREAPVVAARRAAGSLAEKVGLARSELAFALEVTSQGAGVLARRAPDPRLERAVRVRLTLEAMALIVPRNQSREVERAPFDDFSP
jgi:hypothetical protein